MYLFQLLDVEGSRDITDNCIQEKKHLSFYFLIITYKLHKYILLEVYGFKSVLNTFILAVKVFVSTM